MVDRSDLVVCCIERKYGGTYQTIQYADRSGKAIINVMRDAPQNRYALVFQEIIVRFWRPTFRKNQKHFVKINAGGIEV